MKINHGKEIIQLLLDLYAERTAMSISYYDFDTDSFLWSKSGKFSPLCDVLNGEFKNTSEICEACTKDHEKRYKVAKGEIELCHAGLWNITLPIKINNKKLGAISCGTRRLLTPKKANESLKVFQHLLSKENDSKKKKLMEEAYYATTPVEADVFEDVFLTQLVELQRHFYLLSQEQENLKQRVQSLAHNFLLPIQSIIAESENLYYELNDQSQQQNMAQNILHEMQKLAVIAENMRSSLVSSETEKYQYDPHNIYKLLMQGIDLYSSESIKKGVTIYIPTLTGLSKFPTIDMSYFHMKIVINNLLHNAVKYSFSSREHDRYISIRCTASDNFFCIRITNIGTGILPEEISNDLIFEAGYRGNLSADKHRTGSGLGLSEVKRIIKKHKGNIELSSRELHNEMYKTTVTFSLPYKQN